MGSSSKPSKSRSGRSFSVTRVTINGMRLLLGILLAFLFLTIPGGRDFPLEAIHPDAFKAAEAAHCAGEQGKYWEMHDRLFANQRALGVAQLAIHAQALGLNPQPFGQCLDGGKYAAEVRKNLEDGQKAGVRGTPTFFLGLTDAKTGQLRPVKMIVGSQPYTSFKEAIEAVLTAPK